MEHADMGQRIQGEFGSGPPHRRGELSSKRSAIIASIKAPARVGGDGLFLILGRASGHREGQRGRRGGRPELASGPRQRACVHKVWATEGSLVHRTVFRDLHRPEKENEEKPSLGDGRHRPGERNELSELTTDILTPLDVEIEFRIPRSSQKKGRAKGSFAPYFRVGRRVYYRRRVLEAWIADQEQRGGDQRG